MVFVVGLFSRRSFWVLTVGVLTLQMWSPPIGLDGLDAPSDAGNMKNYGWSGLL